MFRHLEHVNSVDYPFNAGYVIFANYFFPQTETGESSSVPLKEFPKAFEKNFEYFVTHDLNQQERDIIYKSFKDKKSLEEIAKDIGVSNKVLTAARTRAFVKLRNMNRSKYILSDNEYIPKAENKSVVTKGDLVVESTLKSPDSVTGGGDYRIVTVRKEKVQLFTVRISAKLSSIMTDDDMSIFIDEIAKLAQSINCLC